MGAVRLSEMQWTRGAMETEHNREFGAHATSLAGVSLHRAARRITTNGAADAAPGDPRDRKARSREVRRAVHGGTGSCPTSR